MWSGTQNSSGIERLKLLFWNSQIGNDQLGFSEKPSCKLVWRSLEARLGVPGQKQGRPTSHSRSRLKAKTPTSSNLMTLARGEEKPQLPRKGSHVSPRIFKHSSLSKSHELSVVAATGDGASCAAPDHYFHSKHFFLLPFLCNRFLMSTFIQESSDGFLHEVLYHWYVVRIPKQLRGCLVFILCGTVLLFIFKEFARHPTPLFTN